MIYHEKALAGEESIESIERREREVEIVWRDGERARFHHIWLRDNCACADCGDRDGGHRYLELGAIDPDITPDTVNLDADGNLEIHWQGDRHLSRYTAAWLRAHRYPRDGANQARITTWDSSASKKPPTWDYPRACDDDAYRLQLFTHLRERGLAIIDAVPVDVDQIERVAALFGFVRETHYGRVFELLATPEQRILAQTAHAIRPHNDELFREPIPGLFMMHCLRASECGGGASIFVDGFNVAALLRDDDPDAFDILCRVPLPHRRFLVDAVDDVALAASHTAIELGRDGEIRAVHVNERTLAPLDTAPELTEPLYRALREFLLRLYDPANCIEHRLEAGQAAIMDNHRVLHARQAFNGHRHIRQCHVDRDEFFSRLRALERRLDPDAWRRHHGD